MNRILQSIGITILGGLLGYQVISVYGLMVLLRNGYYAFDDFLNYCVLPGIMLGVPIGTLSGAGLSLFLIRKGLQLKYILFGLSVCCIVSFYIVKDLGIKVRPILVKAASTGDISQIRTAVSHHVDLNIRDINGRTALMAASYLGDLEIVKLLAQAGADLNAKDNSGLTALMLAIDGWGGSGHFAVVKYLVQAGADIDIKNVNGITALMIASEAGDESMVRFLIQEGADMNAIDNRGWIALTYARYGEHLNLVQILEKVETDEDK